MHVTLYGAAGEVTGSAYHLQTLQASVLVDFGMFQGGKLAEEHNAVPDGLAIDRLDAIVVTHAHLDHTGRLPLLVRRGFRGPIFATPATIEVTGLILRDSAKIQETDTVRLNRKRERAGEPPLAPLYNAQDVDQVMSLFKPVPYDQPASVAPGVTARMVEAGHLLGSASIRLSCAENGSRRELVFSGDLGPRGAPILRDSADVDRADCVFLESTYGDRDHRSFEETVAEMTDLVKRTVEHRGKILVPSFAVGRTQTILYLLTERFRQGQLPPFPIYVDSPMAIEATRLYQNHPELLDEEALRMRAELQAEGAHAYFKPSLTADDSRALNDVPGPCLILAGAGMCNAGRILHHLKQNLWRPETTVLIVGYQSPESLGRLLLEGAKQVSIFGEKIAVRAAVRALGGFSAHAGQTDLLRWLAPMAHCRPQVVLTHGESKGRDALAKQIQERHQLRALLPKFGERIELAGPTCPD